MESIAYPMVNLDGKGQKGFVLFLVEFTHGENGKQIVISLLQIQIEAGKAGPGNHGNGKGVFRRLRLAHHPLAAAVALLIQLVVCQKIPVFRGIGGPDIGKGFVVFVKDSIAWVHLLVENS